jgi:hypothetical protein
MSIKAKSAGRRRRGRSLMMKTVSEARGETMTARGDQQVDLLGCWGEFLKVHVKKGTGWTKAACTNMDTTCA